jgi:CRISPR/Cas system-associated exonuclease Cas4 (RecB family)
VRSKRPFVEHKIAINRNFTFIPWDVSYGRCVLDAAYLEGDEVHVQEWKTGKMYDDHEEQRKINLLFSRACWVASTYTIQTYYFDLGKKKKLVLTHEELDDVRRELEPRLTIMENDDILAPRPGHYCNWCSYSRYKGGPCRKG